LVTHAAPKLLPVAAFEGTRRVLVDTPGLLVSLLEGELRAITATSPVCRLELSGPEAGARALAWAAELRLSVPPDSLAAEAYRLARPGALPVRPLGPPALAPSLDVDAGFAFVAAHLAGVLLHHVPGALAEAGPEPVHQMRVAVRRLRSAILLFRRAVSCPALDSVTAQLKGLGRELGPARDWDVFTLGTGAKVAACFPDDDAVRALLGASERRRKAGYTALRRHLGSPAFRALGIALADLSVSRPWRTEVPDDPASAERRATLQRAALTDYAARALSKRLAPVIAPGADLSALPPEALHDIRLHTKRLRYAAEFFSPLFPGRETRRFLRRMSAVQERLGHLNDATVAAALMADLPRGGASRAYAIGVVRGFVAARTAGGRRKMERTWNRFLKLEPFWT
jgi:CHAD domain-containing protein